MKINALACTTQGAPLAPWTFDSLALAPEECLIKVQACGICHSDLHMMDNDWRISQYPLVPGHEIIGEVVETGTSAGHLKPGDRVGAGWQRSSCLACKDCMSGNENLCSESKGVITHGHGGFADYVRMDSRFCFKLPSGLSADTTAPLLCGGITVYAALLHAGMTHGGHIGVIGVGGLGHMAVQFAARTGNRVTVFTTSEDKAAEAAKLGAHHAVITKNGRMRTAPSRPFNIIISTAPHAQEWTDYIKHLDSDGTLTFVGVPPVNLDIPVGLLLGKRRRIMASPIGGRALIQNMLELSDEHGIGAIVETFSMQQANEALQRVRENKVRYRAVLQA